MTEKSPVDFFNLFIDDEVKQTILNETIRYAHQYMESNKDYMDHHPKARVHDWVRQPIVIKEVDALLAIIIAIGLVGYPTLR